MSFATFENRALKVLIVNRALGTLFGGGESFDLNAARYLKRRGHEVTLLTARPLGKPAKNSFPAFDVVYLPSPALRRFAYATERISTKLSAALYHFDTLLFERAVFNWLCRQPKRRFDIVQCCSLFALPARLLARFGQPVVAWLPGPPSGVARRRLLTLCRNPLFGLFTHGETENALQAMGFERGREYSVIEPGVDLTLAAAAAVNVDGAAAREGLGIGAADLLGVTIARLVPVKNHALLLRAIARAQSLGVCWRWLFVGDGPLQRDLELLAGRLGIADRVHFLGHQAPDEVHRWLAVSDLFAISSTYESYSIATLEAMAHALPVVATRVGYLPQLIQGSDGGLLVNPGDAEAMADALIAMTDPQVRQRHGRSARAFADLHDWSRVADKLERLFFKTIGTADGLHA